MSGRDDLRGAGYPNGHHRETPADLAAVQADDALLDMLGSVGDTPVDADDELTRILAAWRREVRDEPVDELVDIDTALAVIRTARRPIRRRNPVFGSIAAAAAVLVIAFSGVGLFAKSAQPNDQLWSVAQVLYPDYARSVETAAAVRTELIAADKALRQGDTQKAKETLQRVQQQLPVIAEAEGRADLTTQHRQLEQKLNASPDTGSEGPFTTPGSSGSAATSGTFEPNTPSLSEEPTASTGSTPEPTAEVDASDKPSTTMDPREICRGSNPPSGCPSPEGSRGTGINDGSAADQPIRSHDSSRTGDGSAGNGRPGPDTYPGPGPGPGRGPAPGPAPGGAPGPGGAHPGAGGARGPDDFPGAPEPDGGTRDGRPGAGVFMPPMAVDPAQKPSSARTASV